MRGWKLLLVFCFWLIPLNAVAAEKPLKGGTLIYARNADAVRLDLAQCSDMESVQAAGQVCEGLIRYADDSLELIPTLATSWKVSNDGLTWRFNLRRGVKFHDGTPFTAQDVKDSLERVVKKDHPFYRYGKWSIASLFLRPIKEVKVVNGHTVDIITEYPYAALPNNLGSPFCSILSSKAMSELKEKISQKAIGTGPFKFVKWEKDVEIILERNEDYWGTKANLDKIIIKPIPDSSARLMALQSGTVDLADDIDPDSLVLLKKNPNLRIIEKIGCGISYLAMNCLKPNLDKRLVRQAINCAIDKPTLVNTIWQGFAVPAKNPYPPAAAWAYNDAIKPYGYNPAKAKELLEKAGLSKGFEMKFFVMPVSRPYMPEPIKTAELVQAYLAAVGIKASVVRYDWGTYLKKITVGEHDMCVIGWMGASGDPDTFLYNLLSGDTVKSFNRAKWNNVEYTKLVQKGRSIFDRQERTKLYLRAQEIFHEEAPWVPIAHNKVVRCYNKQLHDVPLSPDGHNRFEMVWKEK
jgi:peptide/nickel transport system substrate-binding protein